MAPGGIKKTSVRTKKFVFNFRSLRRTLRQGQFAASPVNGEIVLSNRVLVKTIFEAPKCL